MYRLPLSPGYDVAVLQMVLHYAEDPAAVVAEAARVLAPGGRLIVVDLAGHSRTDVMGRLAHRWPGFTDPAMLDLLRAPGLLPGQPVSVPGALEVRLWPATMPAAAGPPAPAPAGSRRELVSEDA